MRISHCHIKAAVAKQFTDHLKLNPTLNKPARKSVTQCTPGLYKKSGNCSAIKVEEPHE